MPVSRVKRRLFPELGLPTRRTSARSAVAVIAARGTQEHPGSHFRLEREGCSGDRVHPRAAERSAAEAAHLAAVDKPQRPQPPTYLRAQLGIESADPRRRPGGQMGEVRHPFSILTLILK